MSKQILICNSHQEYPVALIQTFAFRGAEFWCPYCGTISGHFDGNQTAHDRLPSIEERARLFAEATRPYLNAKSKLACAFLEWEGKRITPDKLPEAEKKRLNEIVTKGWQLNQKIDI